MRYLYLIALAMLLAMPTVSTHSQEPTADHRLAPERDDRAPSSRSIAPAKCPPVVKGVFTRSGLAQFRLHGGRIQLDPVRYRKGNQSFECEQFTESISVSCEHGVPSAYFQFEDRYQTIRMAVEYGKRFRVESTLNATGETATLEQDAGQPIQWKTQRQRNSPSALDIEASGWTLLHIVGADRAGFEIHFERLFQRALHGRSIIHLANRTEAYLCRNVDQLVVVNRDEVNELVEKLKSGKSAKRRQAARQLSKLASSATPHLHAILQRDDLDPEQTSRIQSILAQQSRIDEDTPSSLACLLSTDRQHWQVIADRLDRQQRIAANEHIRSCGLQLVLQ